MEDLAPPGHMPNITDPDTRVRVVQMVPCDRHVTLRHIGEHLGINLGICITCHASSRVLEGFCSTGAQVFE
jgi:hypothetical protein